MTGYAWTDDAEIERGVTEFRTLWPERWEAWLRFCDDNDDRSSDRSTREVGVEMADKALGVGATCCGEGEACELEGCTGTPAAATYTPEVPSLDEEDE